MNEDIKKNRNRSPNYPYLSLGDAIDKTCIVLDKDKLNPTSPEVIVGHLGYTNLNGTSRRVLAAMKDYGLLEEVGNKRYKVSNVGYKLCKNNETPEERLKLLKEAALTPYFFRHLIEEYKGDLPSPETLVDYLVLEKDFSPDGARSLEKVLRETKEFAMISSEDFEIKQPDNQENSANLGQSQQSDFSSFFNNMFNTPSKENVNKENSPPPEAMIKPLFKYSVPLSIDRNVNADLFITGTSLKKRDMNVLAKKVKDLIDAFEEDFGQIRRNAVWHSKDFDVPVVVVSEPETADDGKEYVGIEGSKSRILLEQLEFEDEE